MGAIAMASSSAIPRLLAKFARSLSRSLNTRLPMPALPCEQVTNIRNCNATAIGKPGNMRTAGSGDDILDVTDRARRRLPLALTARPARTTLRAHPGLHQVAPYH